MEARPLKYFFLIIVLIISIAALAEPSDALNLGTLQKSSAENVGAGETAVFRVLFWNVEEEQYIVKLSDVKAPEGWRVIANPWQFLLGSAASGAVERIYLPAEKGAINAKAVDIYISVPKNETVGSYTVILKATAGNNTDTGFSLAQERRFLFDVNVIRGSSKTATREADKRTVLIDAGLKTDMQETDEAPSRLIPPVFQNQGQGRGINYITVIISIVIIAVAWRIYEYG